VALAEVKVPYVFPLHCRDVLREELAKEFRPLARPVIEEGLQADSTMIGAMDNIARIFLIQFKIFNYLAHISYNRRICGLTPNTRPITRASIRGKGGIPGYQIPRTRRCCRIPGPALRRIHCLRSPPNRSCRPEDQCLIGQRGRRRRGSLWAPYCHLRLRKWHGEDDEQSHALPRRNR